ncbi:SOS response-associated peptidase [Malaciobacter mytili]|uniref:Abasic site processing protein n=1 Tax=Malaciobacter mytili LMG 24559 TaxID=1032238 RepID=A0AAX2AI01_9BACT|nr:SOS response-associated peptidase [Malaciobacter mytili]AXH14592.1 SOS response-associated peptidase [Malaciobacter mytili LMG 24559]RXK16644.1 hypothetical protein CP985_02570 [Malaciobacter mytili LMG 24559]
MPGRVSIYNDILFKKDAKEFIRNDLIQKLNSNYNIAPTMPIPTLLNDGTYLYTHFGFLPSWAREKSSMNINARSESIFEKITFREAFKFRRCIIPINGFFEWKKEEKIPYYVSSLKSDYLALAGIWDEWFDKKLNQKIITVALITCEANEKLAPIHHRMPIVLEKEEFSLWLNSSNLQEVIKLFKVYKSENTNIYEVSTNVNKVLYNQKDCIKEIKKNTIGQLSLF